MAEKEKEKMKTAVILFSINLNDSGKTDFNQIIVVMGLHLKAEISILK